MYLLRFFNRLPMIARRTVWATFLRFASLVLQFAGSVIVARQLGPAGFGAYGYAFTWATVIGAVLGLGLGQLAFREVSKYLALSQYSSLRGYIVFWVGSIFTTATIAGSLLAATEAIGWIRFDVGWPLVLTLAITHALVLGLSSLLTGFQKIIQTEFLESLLRQILFFGAMVLCVVLELQLNTVRVVELAVISVVPVIVILGLMLQKSVSRATGAAIWPVEVRGLTWLAASLPLMFTSLANQMQTSLDTLVLGSMVESSALGVYRAAARGTELAMIAQGLSFRVLGPVLSSSLAIENRLEAQKLISQAAIISMFFGLLICLSLALFPSLYLDLFGTEFREGKPILLILTASQFISILCGPAALILILFGRGREVLILTLAGLVLNIVLKAILIPPLGTIGAALATLVAFSLLKLSLLALAIRATGFDPTILTPIRSWFVGR